MVDDRAGQEVERALYNLDKLVGARGTIGVIMSVRCEHYSLLIRVRHHGMRSG
jgi:hypothetical protein